MFPNISGGAGGIGGDTSAAGDIKNTSSLTFNGSVSSFGTSKMLMIGAGLLVALVIIKKV